MLVFIALNFIVCTYYNCRGPLPTLSGMNEPSTQKGNNSLLIKAATLEADSSGYRRCRLGPASRVKYNGIFVDDLHDISL